MTTTAIPAKPKKEPSCKARSIKEYCPKCRRLIARRALIARGDEEAYIVEVMHRGMKVCAFDLSTVCFKCGTAVRINGEDGIIGKASR